MPPKSKFRQEDIVQAAFNIVRRHGWAGLSARTISEELNSSTMPIYSYLKSMKHLEEAVVKKAMDFFIESIRVKRTGDAWLDSGIGYVLFARDEKHLFRCVNDEKHAKMQREYTAPIWKSLGEELSGYEPLKGLSEEDVQKLRRIRWVMLHGIACLVNSAWIESVDEAEGIDFVKEASQALIEGFRARSKKA